MREQVDALDTSTNASGSGSGPPKLEHARILREVEQQKALDKELNRKRSTMSAREKSEFLEAKKAAGMSGAEAQRAYFELPWS